MKLNTPLSRVSPLKIRVRAGLFGGLLSILLMLYSIRIDQSIIDLRYIPTILLAFYGGAIPAILSLVCAFIGRFFISVNLSSYLSMIIGISVTATALYISKTHLSKMMKILTTVTLGNGVFSIVIG